MGKYIADITGALHTRQVEFEAPSDEAAVLKARSLPLAESRLRGRLEYVQFVWGPDHRLLWEDRHCGALLWD